ncbi:Gfo/Idh/MocA family protein [Calidithermus roseus]|uniref:Glucose-6-phosphate 3-dehydrogenase n=1 Tax=Calidithermus roseus TaxID=1644118 RepID=A0A399ETN2_9DEIN|nr:Gfo/Idh/MocA family oxidoreductase [Calidithermus roseus]RIH86880.1 Glucose-6-phosphate 3-dehydrogenase [Calidithermus roseus]
MRIGIVGAGWWAGFAHLPAFKDAGAEIAGIYSRTPTHAQKLAEQFGVRAFESYEDLLAACDGVAVSTTDDTHAPLGIQALEAGKHLFMDKPLARTVQEGQAIVDAARAHQRIGLTAFTSRGDLAAETAQRLVQSGEVGEILYVRGYFHGGFMGDPQGPTTWRAKAEIGGAGGALADLGAHLFDLVRMVTGLEFTQVMTQAHIHLKRPDPVTNFDEGAVLARLGEASGAFSLSRVHIGADQRLELEIQGSKGALKLSPALWGQGDSFQLLLARRPGFYQPVTPDPSLLRGRNPESAWGYFQFIELARRFLEGARTHRQPSPSLEDGLAAQKVIEAVVQSSQQQDWVAVG